MLSLLLSACTGLPEGVEAVSDVDLDRYLGSWYEIARLDHSFERGLSRVTADYSRREDGGIKVVNRGFNVETAEWQEAEGRAYPVGDPTEGVLKVSFFGPFYGGYNIIALDRTGYQYAMVAGPNRSYLWILARTSRLEENTLTRLLEQAQSLGFAVDELIYPEH
jgi:apolipoprotein D and lipocalin family protein